LTGDVPDVATVGGGTLVTAMDDLFPTGEPSAPVATARRTTPPPAGRATPEQENEVAGPASTEHSTVPPPSSTITPVPALFVPEMVVRAEVTAEPSAGEEIVGAVGAG
jgi:hypothetical protein